MTSATRTRRERRRAETVEEILDAAERQLAEVGVQGLSLRAVARAIGMTVQSLYHYFAGRDDLITALVARAHDDLADAVEAAREAHAAEAPDDRMVAVARAYRDWAVAQPTRFGLAYGVPSADYTAPVDGPTSVGPRRLSAVFVDAVFAGWTPAELAAVTLPGAADGLLGALGHTPGPTADLPPAATALFLVAWGRMHGMVTLEVFGHLTWTGAPAGELFDTAMRLLAADLRALRERARGASAG